MRKAVLISIKPEWCALIAAGEKTVEVRKNKPKIKTPFKCYIYCSGKNTSDPHKLLETHSNDKIHRCNGKVWAEFVCNNIRLFDVPYPAYQYKLNPEILIASGLTYCQLHRYAYHDALFAWHISDFVLYDTPKELNEFRKEIGRAHV